MEKEKSGWTIEDYAHQKLVVLLIILPWVFLQLPNFILSNVLAVITSLVGLVFIWLIIKICYDECLDPCIKAAEELFMKEVAEGKHPRYPYGAPLGYDFVDSGSVSADGFDVFMAMAVVSMAFTLFISAYQLLTGHLF